MVMRYRKRLFASIIMIVCGAMLLVIIPFMMGTAASYVDTSEGASWWRTVWYIGLALGYTAYILMIVGVLLLVITVLRELRAHDFVNFFVKRLVQIEHNLVKSS